PTLDQAPLVSTLRAGAAAVVLQRWPPSVVSPHHHQSAALRPLADAPARPRRLRIQAPSPTMAVLLASLPFGPLRSPSLGLSLLKSALGREGIPASIRYLNLAFARRVGVGTYRTITGH